MRRVIRTSVPLLLVGSVAVVLSGQGKGEGKMPVVPQTPEWQNLKSLVGQWEGTIDDGGKAIPTKVEIRMTCDGSAIMHLMDEDTPHEMVTMIHPDGKRLLATRYCAANNPPRMALVPSGAQPGGLRVRRRHQHRPRRRAHDERGLHVHRRGPSRGGLDLLGRAWCRRVQVRAQEVDSAQDAASLRTDLGHPVRCLAGV
jgi:hypothetical protein